MTPLPAFPTFNRDSEPAGLPAPAKTEAAVFADAAASISIQSSPAPFSSSLPSGESEPAVMSAWGADDAAARTDVLQTVGATVSARCEPFGPPVGYVLIAQSDIDRMMALIAELQAEREADRIDHADYNRLLEKERVELLEPLPMFLRQTAPVDMASCWHGDITEDTHNRKGLR